MQYLETALAVLGGILVLAGVAIVYAAPKIVEKKGLAEKKKVDPERIEGLDDDAKRKFRKESAILDIKVKGILVALPGAILIMVLCRI